MGNTQRDRLYLEATRFLSAQDSPEAQALAARMQAATPSPYLTTTAARQILGVSSINTVKNWIEQGHFPQAVRTKGGHYRLLREEVYAVKRAMDAIRYRNEAGDLDVTELDDEDPEDVPVF